MGFVFGGEGNPSYEELQRKRKVAQAMMQRGGTPRNVGEGLDKASSQILGALMQRKADQGQAKLQGEFDQQYEAMVPEGMRQQADLLGNPMASPSQRKVLAALMKGTPGFRYGTRFAPGGEAVVGEDGPEVVKLPRGAQVIPNPQTQMAYDDGGPASNPDAHRQWLQQQIDQASPEEMEKIRAINEQMPQHEIEQHDPASQERMRDDPEAMQPPPMDMREMLPQEESRFDDAAAYKTADMSGIAPSGVGEKNQLNSAARSFQGFMKSLADYEEMFADGGSTAWPGVRKDQLATAHRDLQMLSKELYNLGVLNGPDLMLMDQILISPTSVTNNVKDALGISDMEKRIPANIKEVRRMMTNRMTPGLQQLGVDPQSLMPANEMSDEDYLKSLGLE